MQYKSIGMKESDYQVIAGKKLSVENLVGKRLNWADFLLLLANLRPVDEIAGERRDNIAELHDIGGEEEAVDPDEYEEIPPWVTRQEVKEIVRAEADRIISELKHTLIKK